MGAAFAQCKGAAPPPQSPPLGRLPTHLTLSGDVSIGPPLRSGWLEEGYVLPMTWTLRPMFRAPRSRGRSRRAGDLGLERWCSERGRGGRGRLYWRAAAGVWPPRVAGTVAAAARWASHMRMAIRVASRSGGGRPPADTWRCRRLEYATLATGPPDPVQR